MFEKIIYVQLTPISRPQFKFLILIAVEVNIQV